MTFTLDYLSAAVAAIFPLRSGRRGRLPRFDHRGLNAHELADLNLPADLRAAIEAARNRVWQRFL